VRSKCSSKRLPCGARLSPLLPHKQQGWNCLHLLKKVPLRSRSSCREHQLWAIYTDQRSHSGKKYSCYPINCDTTYTFGPLLPAFSQMCNLFIWCAPHAMPCPATMYQPARKKTCTPLFAFQADTLRFASRFFVVLFFLELTYSV
jgi:hypothetical protein